MRSKLIAVVACAGCNGAFGLHETGLVDAPMIDSHDTLVVADRDRDDVPDVDDPCINSIADLKGDAEGDSYLNEVDGCAFEYESIDSDGDTIYDECDPLRTVAGDRRRCIMAFQNANLNYDLWSPPAGDTAMWNLLGLSGIVGSGTGRLVAAERFEAPVATSYDLQVFIGPPLMAGMLTAVTMWLRTNDAPAPADVGCGVRGDTTTSTVTLLGAPVTTEMTVARPVRTASHVQATLEPGVSGRNNVRCTVLFGTVATAVSVAAEVALPAGTFGLGVANASTSFFGLTVLERDDAPPL